MVVNIFIKVVVNTIKVVGLQPKVVSKQLKAIAMLTKAFGILPIVLLNMVAYNKQVVLVVR